MSSDEVVVEVRDPSDGSTSIPLQAVDENANPVSAGSDSPTGTGILSRTIGQAGHRLGRLNPWREPTPEELEKKKEEKAAAEEERKRKLEEAALDKVQEDVEGEATSEVGCCRRWIAKCLPAPWNYIVAGSPTSAGAAYGAYWLVTKYMIAGDEDKKE